MNEEIDFLKQWGFNEIRIIKHKDGEYVAVLICETEEQKAVLYNSMLKYEYKLQHTINKDGTYRIDLILPKAELIIPYETETTSAQYPPFTALNKGEVKYITCGNFVDDAGHINYYSPPLPLYSMFNPN